MQEKEGMIGKVRRENIKKTDIFQNRFISAHGTLKNANNNKNI